MTQNIPGPSHALSVARCRSCPLPATHCPSTVSDAASVSLWAVWTMSGSGSTTACRVVGLLLPARSRASFECFIAFPFRSVTAVVVPTCFACLLRALFDELRQQIHPIIGRDVRDTEQVSSTATTQMERPRTPELAQLSTQRDEFFHLVSRILLAAMWQWVGQRFIE